MAPCSFLSHLGSKMTVQEVADALAARMPGRWNDLPTPMKKGTRVAIPTKEFTAYGTLRGSYGTEDDATALVELDGTGQVVDVPWAWLAKEE